MKKLFLIIPFVLIIIICNVSYATQKEQLEYYNMDEDVYIRQQDERTVSLSQFDNYSSSYPTQNAIIRELILIIINIIQLMPFPVFALTIVFAVMRKHRLKKELNNSEEDFKKKMKKINRKLTIGIIASILLLFLSGILSTVIHFPNYLVISD